MMEELDIDSGSNTITFRTLPDHSNIIEIEVYNEWTDSSVMLYPSDEQALTLAEWLTRATQ